MKLLSGTHFLTNFKIFFYYFQVSAVFLLLFLLGLNVCKYVLITKNKAINIGTAMILGPLIYLLVLSTNGYIYKGPLAIQLYSVVLAILIVFITLKNRREHKKLFLVTLTGQNIIAITIYILLFTLITLWAGTTNIGGDVLTQWSIGNSFIRGNYPSMQPWQPEYLTTYHQATYMVIAALQMLSHQNITYLHVFFSIYLCIALVFILTGLAREKTHGVITFLPAIIGLWIFTPVFLTSISPISSLLKFPTYNQIKEAPGGGPQDLDGLLYLNFVTFSIGIFIVLLLVLTQLSSGRKKFIAAATISALLAAVNEAGFLMAIPFLINYLAGRNRLKLLVLSSFVFLLFFIIIQNPIRDSLITPTWDKTPRFAVLTFRDPTIFKRIEFIRSKTVSLNNLSASVLDLRMVISFVLLISILLGSQWAILFSFSSLFCLLAGVSVNNTFWPENAIRFLNQANQWIYIALGFCIIEFVIRKNKILRSIGVAFIIILIPSFLVVSLRIKERLTLGQYPNILIKKSAPAPILDWISRNLPFDKKVAFVDEYPISSQYSPLALGALFQYGIFVPTVDHGPKVNNYDHAGEYMDIAAGLAPYAIKNLGVEYVYIKNIRQLEIPDYFHKQHEDWEGILYKINRGKIPTNNSEVTFNEIFASIGKNKKVYVDTFPFPEIRKEIFVKMFMKQNQMYGKPYLIGNDNYLFIEANIKIRQDSNKLDFAILNKNNTPESLALDGKFKKINESRFVTLWKN